MRVLIRVTYDLICIFGKANERKWENFDSFPCVQSSVLSPVKKETYLMFLYIPLISYVQHVLTMERFLINLEEKTRFMR